MTERSAIETAAAIARGESSARAEVEAAIARIEARDGAINAVVVRDFDRARAAADQADAAFAGGERRPLLGVPMTVKEAFNVAGLPTTWGFEQHRNFIAGEDAVAVKRLKAAGAIILGKTNVPVGLADHQSANPVYGRTLNPLDPGRSPGGSSGGSAAAVASGMVPLELGSDIGGSIRVPAAFNGIWGHKPTYGALSADGHNFPGTDGHAPPMAVIGPLARDPDDLALALDLLADLPLPRPQLREPGQWRLLLLARHPFAATAAPVVDAVERVGAAFEAAGATVDRESDLLPDLSAQFGQYMPLLMTALSRGAAAPGQEPTIARPLVRAARRPGARRPRLAPPARPLRRRDRADDRDHRLPARRHAGRGAQDRDRGQDDALRPANGLRRPRRLSGPARNRAPGRRRCGADADRRPGDRRSVAGSPGDRDRPRRARSAARMRRIALILLLLLSACSRAPADDPRTEEAAIRHVIADMEAAWNRGDFRGYMAGFKNPDVIFVSRGQFQQGWQGTLDHYVRDYGGAPARRGHLHFWDIRVELLAPDAAQLISRYRLDGGDRPQEGINTRLMRKVGGRWVIALNHVSAREAAPAATSGPGNGGAAHH